MARLISLWSGPRCRSTAVMYSVAQRSDVEVVDEPLFGHYLSISGAARPSREEVLVVQATDPFELVRALQPGPRVRFFKHMANHLEGWPAEDFADHKHVLLTRHPRRVLKSYRAHIEEPTALDLCYHHQHAWLSHCLNAGWPVAVVDSDRLVADPRASLTALMDWLGLDFDERMLTWPAGPRKEDGVWAKYWYHRVHASTGWDPRPMNDQELPEPEPRFREFVEELEPLYFALSEQAIN